MKKLVLFLVALLGINSYTQAQFTLADSSEVSTFAGNGTSGSTDGLGSAASFNNPGKICIDGSGNLYVADINNKKIRKITSGGLVTTLAGSGVSATVDGQGANASFASLDAMCIDAAGNLYVIDWDQNTITVSIRKISSSGSVSTITSFQAGFLTDMDIDNAGNFYIVSFGSYGAYGIVKLDPTGTSSTSLTSGTTINGYFPAICTDGAGNVYFSHEGLVSKISTAGVITNIAGSSGHFNQADGLGGAAKFDDMSEICRAANGELYVNDFNVIRKIRTSGYVTTMAGNESVEGSIDGVGKSAGFGQGSSLCVDASGNIYVSDRANNKIRKIKRINPSVPVINYPSLPAHVCAGSAVNYQPASTGGSVNITAQVDSVLIAPQKLICKNDSNVYVVCEGDSILRYDLDGNLKQSYVLYYGNISAITVDNQNRIYLAVPDALNNAISTVVRLNQDGSQSSYQFPNYIFGYIVGLAFSPADGHVYLADTTSGYLTQLDTGAANYTALAMQQNLHYSYAKPSGISIGANGQIFLSDIMLKQVLTRDAATGNYYQYFSHLDSLNWQLQSIEVDTFGLGALMLTTPTKAYYVQREIASSGDTLTESIDLSLIGAHSQAPVGLTCALNSASVPVMWIADKGSNYLKRAAIFGYQISPNLPTGLKYDFINGKIVGTPQVATAGQTYSITVTSVTGASHTSTIYFEVDPSGPLSNANGSINSIVVNQTAGLTVNYNDANSCSKLMTIADSIGGASPGNTKVTQTVYPTIATFGTGQFAPRVNQVDAQNTSAPAGLTMYFTYQDIVNFNTSNTAGQHLSNDTTTGTMQVAVMQVHKDNNGHVTAIPHNPITAKWISKDKDWEVDFPVTKFSTFYMGTTNSVDSFNCVNGHADTITTTNNYYIWHNDTLFYSGDYSDTLANKTLCDSICTINLTINQTTGIATPLLNESVSIYPNPSNGLLNIDITNPNVAINNIRIINLIGAEVYNSNGNNHNSKIDLSSLPNGVYIISITTQQETTTRRILKE